MSKIIDAIITLHDSFTPTMHKVENALTEHEKTQMRTARSIQSTGRSITGLGEKISLLTAPLAAAATEGLRLNSQFTAGMAKVATLLGNDFEAANRLKAGLRDLSDQTGVSVTDLAAAEYQAISAGVDAAHATEFMRSATMLAQAGFADESTTIDALTSVLNAYGLSADQAAHISDEFILTQNLGKTTVAEMAQTIGSVIPIASAAGVQTEELMSSIAALTKNGMKTPDAMTALKGAISSIIKPSQDAAKTAAELGIELSGAHLKEVGLTGILDEVREKAGGNVDVMAKLFPNVRALNAMLALTGPAAGTYNQAMEEMRSANGLTIQTYEQLVKNDPTRALSIAMNELKNAGMDLGAGLGPVLLRTSQMIKTVASAINSLTPDQKEMLVNFMQTAIMVGLSTMAIGRAITMYGNFRRELVTAGQFLTRHRTQIETVAGSYRRIPGLLTSLGNGINSAVGMIVTRVGQIPGALGVVGRSLAGIPGRFAAGFARISGLLRGFNPIAMIRTALTGGLNGIMGLLGGFGSRIWAVFRTLATVVRNPIASFRAFFTAIRAGFTAIRVLMASNPIGLALLTLTIVIGIVIAHWRQFQQAFTTVWNIVNSVTQSAISNITGRLSALMEHGGVVINKLVNLWNVLTGQTESSSTIMTTIINTLASVFSIAWIVISTSVEVAVGVIANITDGLFTILGGIIDFITGVFTGNWEQAWEGVKAIFQGIIDSITGIFRSAMDGISSLISRIRGEAKDANEEAQAAQQNSGGESNNWTGTQYFPGGTTWLHEQGPEIVRLPTGSQIVPHSESLALRWKEGFQAGMNAFRAGMEPRDKEGRRNGANQPVIPVFERIRQTIEPSQQAAPQREPGRNDRYADGLTAGMALASTESRGNRTTTININSLVGTAVVKEQGDINKIADALFFKLKATAINRM